MGFQKVGRARQSSRLANPDAQLFIVFNESIYVAQLHRAERNGFGGFGELWRADLRSEACAVCAG